MGLKIPSFYSGLSFAGDQPSSRSYQEPTPSHRIRTKDSLITQQMTKVLRALFQNQGSKTNICFSPIISQDDVTVYVEKSKEFPEVC